MFILLFLTFKDLLCILLYSVQWSRKFVSVSISALFSELPSSPRAEVKKIISPLALHTGPKGVDLVAVIAEEEEVLLVS